MSSIELHADSGIITPKAHIRNSSRQVWNGSAFVAYDEDDRATYDISLPEDGLSGYYYADVPAGIPAGRYTVLFYDDENGSLGGFSSNYDGTNWEAGWLTPSRTLTGSPDRIKKNTALSNFSFVMVDSEDHVTAKMAIDITAQRSIDGAAFESCANDVTELSDGVYLIDLAAADLNGDVITFMFSATGADTRFVTVVTQP